MGLHQPPPNSIHSCKHKFQQSRFEQSRFIFSIKSESEGGENKDDCNYCSGLVEVFKVSAVPFWNSCASACESARSRLRGTSCWLCIGEWKYLGGSREEEGVELRGENVEWAEKEETALAAALPNLGSGI